MTEHIYCTYFDDGIAKIELKDKEFGNIAIYVADCSNQLNTGKEYNPYCKNRPKSKLFAILTGEDYKPCINKHVAKETKF
jgi:hypothetical protein